VAMATSGTQPGQVREQSNQLKARMLVSGSLRCVFRSQLPDGHWFMCWAWSLWASTSTQPWSYGCSELSARLMPCGLKPGWHKGVRPPRGSGCWTTALLATHVRRVR
jgi:hypothetical protein